jgi:hypothetical protein
MKSLLLLLALSASSLLALDAGDTGPAPVPNRAPSSSWEQASPA